VAEAILFCDLILCPEAESVPANGWQAIHLQKTNDTWLGWRKYSGSSGSTVAVLAVAGVRRILGQKIFSNANVSLVSDICSNVCIVCS